MTRHSNVSQMIQDCETHPHQGAPASESATAARYEPSPDSLAADLLYLAADLRLLANQAPAEKRAALRSIVRLIEALVDS